MTYPVVPPYSGRHLAVCAFEDMVPVEMARPRLAPVEMARPRLAPVEMARPRLAPVEMAHPQLAPVDSVYPERHHHKLTAVAKDSLQKSS